MTTTEPTTATSQSPAERIAALESALSLVTVERDRLRDAYQRLLLDVELMRRRMFIAKAERVDTAQLELEFAAKLAELDRLSGLTAAAQPPAPARTRKKPTGRRNLRTLPLEEVRIVIADPLGEQRVAEGKAERMSVEESAQLAFKRGGMRRLVVTRITYKDRDEPTGDSSTDTTTRPKIWTAAKPKETFPGCIAAPSLLAHIIVQKYLDGMPLYRLERRFAREGVTIDRGSMARWMEDAGATFGATVVAAARADALRTAFCIATDATGVLVQPEPRGDKKRQPCRRGHYFVMIADRDHILFEYTPHETSQVVSELFRGYTGYVQADAKSVYDVLFRPPEDDEPPDGERREVGCWSHARTKFWEAAVTKSATAREGLVRIGRFFALEEQWRGKPPDEVKRLRDSHLRVHMDEFFAWAEQEYERIKDQRGLLRSALGYVVRQKAALLCVLEDGRLVLENNRSERELRSVAVGRKAWLFVGSDDHGVAAGNLFSLLASARLHRLDPELYIRDLIRVLAYWPKERHLELAPKYWSATRARLDPVQLEQEVGYLTVPPPLETAQPLIL